MSFFTASDLSRYAAVTGAPEELMARYFDTAITMLNDATCNAIQTNAWSTVTSMVSDDGTTVHMPKWMSNISAVTIDGAEQGWSTEYNVGDIDPDTGHVADGHTRTITLHEPRPEGTTVVITGVTGFDSLPASIKTLIANMIANLANRDNGTDLVTSKKIEDVSETITDRKARQSPLVNLSDTYGALLQKWSLCEDGQALEGLLSMPERRRALPWYVSEADVRGAYDAC